MKKIIILMLLMILVFVSSCQKKIDCTAIPLDADNEWLDKCTGSIISNTTSITVKNVTALFVIDCSLPEIFENDTVEIVYGEVIKDSNVIEISFTEFCRKLNPKECNFPENPLCYVASTT